MKEKSTEMVGASSPTWEMLETFARQSMQQFVQRMLEAEVEELLARARYERVSSVVRQARPRRGRACPRSSLGRMVTFYRFPREHWQHLRVESGRVAVGDGGDHRPRHVVGNWVDRSGWAIGMVKAACFSRGAGFGQE